MPSTGPGPWRTQAEAVDDTRIMASKEKRYFCPNCGQPIEPGRIGGATTWLDVLKTAVIFAGVIGIIWVVFHRG